MGDKILQVTNLTTGFAIGPHHIPAIENISFSIHSGQTLGLVGESGSGKSVTALSLMRLIPAQQGKILNGEVTFRGQNLLTLSPEQMRKLRGDRISMIFQEPMTSLNPLFTVGMQVGEVLRTHTSLSHSERRQKAIELLQLVQIPSPEAKIDDYPHQLSGGLRQRVMIAMALACKPDLLIADEPTTALDVTIQAQILDLMKQIQKEMGMSILLITHDLGVVAEVCDTVGVMYGGRLVEYGAVRTILTNPQHPYTKGLLASRPRFGQRQARLQTIPGQVPPIGRFPMGCRFQNRCQYALKQCQEVEPNLTTGTSPSHKVACWLPRETEKPI